MNPLPQRKKSAEEIAKLRESFGIPGQEPGAEPMPAAAARPATPAAEKTGPPACISITCRWWRLPAWREPRC